MKTRKILSGISALVLAATMAVPFSAFAEDTAAKTINTDGGSDSTNVIYNADEKYFVTIPAGVTLKDTAVTANITASDVIIGEGKIIKVTLFNADNTESGNLFSAKNSAKNSTVSYNINNGTVSVGGVIAKFDKDNLTEALTFTKTDDVKPTHAGKHSENLTFTIGVEDAKTNVASVTITDKSTTTLTKGGTLNLTATVDESATDKTVTWTSNDATVASVDANGEVTANKTGTAIITVTATNGTEDTSDDRTDSIAITVTNPLTNINIPATLELVTGKSGNLTATVTPPDADDTTVTWTSSNETVATVDNTGKVTAIAAGTATITAKAGDKTATCQVTVTVATLADAFKNGSTTAVTFKDFYNDYNDTTITFTKNNDQYSYSSSRILPIVRSFTQSGDKIIITCGLDGDSYGEFTITLDKSDNSYSVSDPNDYFEVHDLQSVVVNGVDIKDTLSKK